MTFVDTGAFLGRWLASDQHHSRAQAGWARLENRREPLFTSNFVLDETFTLLGRRAGHCFAVERARNLYRSSVLRILRPEIDDEIEALRLFEKYSDQRASFTDCVSFALMSRSRLVKVFTFDALFVRAGFVPLSVS